MKVIIAGGGTGGHLFPAVAVGEELRRQAPECEVLYAGASNGLEARWLPQHGLPHELLRVRGLTGKGPLTRLRALIEFVGALRHARALVRRFAPDLVLGAGGYASAPVAVAALRGRVPLVLMEQNTRPGLSNRILWRFARKICVGFEDAAAAFDSDNVVVTGNPVRFQIGQQAPPDDSGPVQILVLGGSSGAHRLNIGVLKAFSFCTKTVINLRITHQTGDADVEMVTRGYEQLGRPVTVAPFIEEMGSTLTAADLVIARAGAMTVSEVALAGRAAIFVPYPFHRDRQQELNAHVLERRGAARVVPDDEQLGENLAKVLSELAADGALRRTMGDRARAVGRPDAAAEIARICFAEAGGEVRAA